MMLTGGHLIYFEENLRVVYLEERKIGGNRDTQMCHIEGDLAIPTEKTQDTMKKVQFNAKAMALRSTHGLHKVNCSSSIQIQRIHSLVEWGNH
jgi:hypothetical protein